MFSLPSAYTASRGGDRPGALRVKEDQLLLLRLLLR